MKLVFRLLLIPAILATFFVFTSPRPASASPCVISTGSGTGTDHAHLSLPIPGHMYRFRYTAADGATGHVSYGGSSSTWYVSWNGFTGPVNWTLYDMDRDCQGQDTFDPADGRIAAAAGDRVAVYCNTTATPPNLDVWGVTDDSVGHKLFQFAYADLVKAGAAGIMKNVEPMGSIWAAVDANNNFTVKWFGGPAGAIGEKDFAKSFTCSFAQ